MAVLVEVFEVIVRVDGDASRIETLAKAAPNASFCTDGLLARVAFMREDDRDHFFASLEIEADAIALVDGHSEPPTRCEWLDVGHYSGVRAAWRRGEPREPLVVPLTWRPGSVDFRTSEQVEKDLQYVDTKDGVDHYVDRRTGRAVYSGRTRPRPDDTLDPQLTKLREQANALVAPFIGSQKPKLGFFERRRLRKGIALLERVRASKPDHGPTLWLLGMGLRALESHRAALECLRRAFAANPGQVDFAREYAGQCMIVGETAEAVAASRKAHLRFPDDVGLHSNLALALLIAGELDEAELVAKAALDRDPGDPITHALLGYVRDVKAGRKERPRSMPGW